MITNDKVRWAFITALFPFCGLVSSIKANRTYVFPGVFAIFFFFIGTQIIAHETSDFRRYMMNFSLLSMQSGFSFEYYFISLNESNQIDFYLPFMTWFVSRFTSNTQVFAGILAMLYGICLSFNFKYITKYCDNSTLCIILFFVLVLLPKVSYTHRWWMAMQVFLLGALPYILEGKYKFLLFSIASIFIHFSFLYPLVILLVYKFLPKHSLIPYVLIFIVSNLLESLDIGSIAGVIGQYLPDSFNSRNEAYINAEFQDHSWFSQSGRVTWKFLNIGLVLYIFFQLRGYLKYRPEYKSLLVCALLIGTFSAIANLTEWGWRYLDVTNFMFCSLYILILADSKVFGLKFDNVIRIASPFFVYIILFQLRGILEIIGINALCVGNVLTTWFIEDSCPVLSLIK
ncbi:EpsG family protein [uncultured Parabacteroides sp.]|uniref:EpsG family protein n=1 Tax=uncultured Parabacteroides sp. TaxID=512312 RepID=UPI00265E72BE|nr:EpsG family protein [uncultured Parabacteroides sp.]